MMLKKTALVLLLTFTLFGSGCVEVAAVKKWVFSLLGSEESSVSKAPSPTPSVSPSPPVVSEGGVPLTSQAARNAKENAELFQEIYRVVLLREPTNRGEFGNWVDSMNQGASLEGVYNGLIHSNDYKKLEIGSGNAPPEALRVFAEELIYLAPELGAPPEFEFVGSLPVAKGVEPAPTDSDRFDAVKPTPAPLDAEQTRKWVDQYSHQFVGNSIYTLKRVLGDEVLRVAGRNSQFHEKLALWYSRWVVHLAKRNIDFGVPLRNSPDEGLHYKWALQAPEDRLKWEVLNRVHRVLNSANQQKQ